MTSNERGEKAVIDLFRSLKIRLPQDTPQRYLSMLNELTEYQNISNREIAESIGKTFHTEIRSDSKCMVIVKDIEAFSLCEHHISLMYDIKISVAYIPNSFILSTSKIVRASEMVCKRLQLQERIGNDITEVLSILTRSPNVAVHIKAKQSCITARGIKNINLKEKGDNFKRIENVNAETITTNFSGLFSDDKTLQMSFLEYLKT